MWVSAGWCLSRVRRAKFTVKSSSTYFMNGIMQGRVVITHNDLWMEVLISADVLPLDPLSLCCGGGAYVSISPEWLILLVNGLQGTLPFSDWESSSVRDWTDNWSDSSACPRASGFVEYTLVYPVYKDTWTPPRSSWSTNSTRIRMESIKKAFESVVSVKIREYVKDYCKRNGLLTLSVIAVVTGCVLGFLLRSLNLSTQVWMDRYMTFTSFKWDKHPAACSFNLCCKHKPQVKPISLRIL